jgi:hemoglobin
MTQPSLFTQVGEAAVGVVVDKFLRLVLADPELAPVFEGVDAARLARHQKAFVVAALGGPNRYSGRALRTAHARLGGRIGDYEFDKVLAHLGRAMAFLNLDRNVLAAVLETVDSVRADVLNRPAPA